MSISIDVARRILEASKQRAYELRSPVSIAIVDASGHLVLFERMMSPHGWATANISLAKASTAVMFNQSTDSVAQWGSGIPGFASSMATMTQGKFIMAAGGWPIRVGGTTIGGIGVSGGNAPGRDDEIAKAGLNAAEGGYAAIAPQRSQQRPPTPTFPPVPTPSQAQVIPVYVPPPSHNSQERPSMQPMAAYPSLPSQPGSESGSLSSEAQQQQQFDNMAQLQNVPPSTQNLPIPSEQENLSNQQQGQEDGDAYPSGGQS